MKRILSAFLLIGGLIMVGAPAAHATNENAIQLKVDICHNGTVVPVSVNAAAVIDTGHGLFNVATHDFTARVDVPGHANDSVLRYYSKFGNFESSIYVNEDQTCVKEGPQGPPGDDGTDGEDGDNGLTPTLICVPGVGIRATFSDEPVLAEDEFILNDESEVCPLAGKDGTNGTDGTDGTDGLNGTNGTNGSNGTNGVDGKNGVDGVTSHTSEVIVQSATPAETTTTTVPAAVAENPPASPGSLAHTGVNATVWLAGLGLLVLALGIGLRFFRTSTN